MLIFEQRQGGEDEDQGLPKETVPKDMHVKEVFIEVGEDTLSDPVSLDKIRKYMAANVLITLYVITTMSLGYWWASCLIRERLKAAGANDIARAVIIYPTSP